MMSFEKFEKLLDDPKQDVTKIKEYSTTTDIDSRAKEYAVEAYRLAVLHYREDMKAMYGYIRKEFKKLKKQMDRQSS